MRSLLSFLAQIAIVLVVVGYFAGVIQFHSADVPVEGAFGFTVVFQTTQPSQLRPARPLEPEPLPRPAKRIILPTSPSREDWQPAPRRVPVTRQRDNWERLEQ